MALHVNSDITTDAATEAAEYNWLALHPDRGVFFGDQDTEWTPRQIHRTIPLGDMEFDFTYEGPNVELEDIPYLFPFFSGFGGIKDSSSPFSKSMAKRGLGILTIDPIRADDRSHKERLFEPHKAQVEAVATAIDVLYREEGLILGPDATMLVPIAHSMGGEPSIEFAERYKPQVAAVLLMATIGFGSPSIRRMCQQIPKDIIPGITEELWPFMRHPDVPKTLRTIAKATGYFILNPERTLGEIGSCLTSDLSDRCAALVKDGIPVIYGQPVHDALVQGGKEAAKHVSTVSEIERAGHMIFQAKPERAADWIIHSLQTFELSRD